MRFAPFLGATALTLAPMMAQAQNAPSLWDLLKPEYLVQRLVQTGIMALRTQVDLKYSAMSVDLRIGQVGLSDITLWPLFQWDTTGDCAINADRLTIRAAPLNRPDLIRFKLQVQGVSVPEICWPADQRQVLTLVGLSDVVMPRLTVDMEYDIAAAEADLHAFTQIDNVAALDITADMAYLWFDGRFDMENPEPVVYLRRAAVTVENLGGFEAAKQAIPPAFVNPEQAPVMVEAMLGAVLGGMNRDNARADATGDPSALTAPQIAFVESVKESWPRFLEDPDTIVLETGFDPADDVFVDFYTYENTPATAFGDLMPRMSLAPAPARKALSADLVRQALGDGAAELDDEDKRAVGIGLITGVGVPRNLPAGRAILTELAEAGDGLAALELSAALEQRAPEEAYRWALLAGDASQGGAAARLDRLETRLPFADVLALQSQVAGDTAPATDALQSVGAMRDEAMASLSGIGRVRSYSSAALWALMGAAAGDGESLDILQDIDERVSMSDGEGRAAWEAAEADASDQAMEAWLGQDLPERFGAD